MHHSPRSPNVPTSLSRLIANFYCDLKLCSACKMVRYCNADCQRADWKAHRFACKEREEKLNELESRVLCGYRVDVYYARTDNTRGCKEWSCVVVHTRGDRKTGLRYYDDVYEPHESCDYKVLYEVPMYKMDAMLMEMNESLNSRQWVSSPIKERVLQFWKDNTDQAIIDASGA